MKTKEDIFKVFTGSIHKNTFTGEDVEMFCKRDAGCMIDQAIEISNEELSQHNLFTKFRTLASDPTIEHRERTAAECVKLAQSYADQAVQQRNEEIKKWIRDNNLARYINADIAIADLFKFLSTPSLPKESTPVQSNIIEEVKRLIEDVENPNHQWDLDGVIRRLAQIIGNHG